jgi:hypothetical protein
MAGSVCVFHDKLNAHVKDLVASDADPGTRALLSIHRVAAIVVNCPCKPGQGRAGAASFSATGPVRGSSISGRREKGWIAGDDYPRTRWM